MRILHLITSLNTGGAEVMLQKLTRALQEHSHALSVISLTTDIPIGLEIREQGVPVLALGGRGGLLLPHQLWRLVRAYRGFRPEIVHSWMYHANVLAQLLPVLSMSQPRPGLVISVRGAVHAPEQQKITTRVVRAIDARMSHRADAIIFNSRRSAQQHAALGYDSSKINVIPNCFDTNQYRPMSAERARIRAELGCVQSLLIGLVARFDRLKNHRVFLQAARSVAGRCPRARFLLAGRGCDGNNRQLMQWIAELGLKDRIHALGERRDIVAIDNALDVAVCSSISESFPNAIGEAMACGVPTVVTDVGDCPYLVGDTGRVVESENPQALADAIVELGSLPPEARASLGARARERVMGEFSLERITRQFADVYDAYMRRN
jgi:glycosyltransferase involved in cell wall biosynthesis